MSEALETIWASRDGFWFREGPEYARTVEYRRADLPATDEQAFANEKVKALVEANKRIDFLLSGALDALCDGDLSDPRIDDLAECHDKIRATLAATKEKP